MSNKGIWPDPTRPGYPLRPDEEGWHWLREDQEADPIVALWFLTPQGSPEWLSLEFSGHGMSASTAGSWIYLGPCQLPERIAADLRAAAAEGWSNGRDEAAKQLRKKAADYHAAHGSLDPSTGVTEYPGNGAEWMDDWEETADEISALPVPNAAALADVEARVELRLLEQIMRECLGPLVGASDGGTYTVNPPDLMRIQRRITELRARGAAGGA